MYKVQFLIEIITPAFLGNAEQEISEIRPSEIKGLLRFWWRAVRGEKDISILQKEESEIFGSQKRKSPFNLRVKVLNKDSYLKPAKEVFKKSPSGAKYLLYSFKLGKKEVLTPGCEFEIILNSQNKEILKKIIAVLWCLIFLGGLGARARRGGGNLAVKKIWDESQIVKETELEFFPVVTNGKNLTLWIKANFLKVKKLLNGGESFSSLYSNLSVARILVSQKKYDTFLTALNELGERYKNFRKKLPLAERGIFGIPLKGFTAYFQKNRLYRRASSLVFKVIKTDSGFYWMILRLGGEFFPQGSMVKFQGKIVKLDYEIIDEFWNTLKTEAYEEVLNIPKFLEKILNRIIKTLKPRRIILFGSRARGDFHTTSDIDIAVETDIPLSTLELLAPLDIVNLKKIDTLFKEKIIKEGIVLYEKD
jgi:CRISPR-associated protein Cmr1